MKKQKDLRAALRAHRQLCLEHGRLEKVLFWTDGNISSRLVIADQKKAYKAFLAETVVSSWLWPEREYSAVEYAHDPNDDSLAVIAHSATIKAGRVRRVC